MLSLLKTFTSPPFSFPVIFFPKFIFCCTWCSLVTPTYRSSTWWWNSCGQLLEGLLLGGGLTIRDEPATGVGVGTDSLEVIYERTEPGTHHEELSRSQSDREHEHDQESTLHTVSVVAWFSAR